MTQEQKDLLLKDICARLPYNPMVEYKGGVYNIFGINHGRLSLCLYKPFMAHILNESPLVEEVKLYLFPLSSMTEEQKTSHNFLKYSAYTNPIKLVDWYNKNHFDYRGLIPLGLAIDATGLNIY